MSTQPAIPSDFSSETEPVAATDLQIDQYAVMHCRKLYEDAYKAGFAKGGQSSALRDANRAYCDALPPLLGASNIRRFIACVTQGFLLNVFGYADTARLLYAAQVANSALKKCSKSPKTKAKSAT